MISFTHVIVALSLCGLMYSLVEFIPELFAIYQSRYKENLLRTTRELNRFFLNVKPTKIMIGLAIFGVLAGIATNSWVLTVAIALLGIFAPRIALNIWKEMRSSQVDSQLMDALLILSNSLKSGLDIAAGIERVAATMPAPISEEFGLVVNSYRLGTPLETALVDLTERINSRTLETVVTAINIQRESGGNIIKIFEQLIDTIREEDKLQKKTKALTAQGRLQIAVLSIFPWIFAVLMYNVNADMMKPALQNTWGQIGLAVLVLWEIVGIFVTRRMMRVDI